MEYRRLGKAGVKVSVLSLGAWVTYGGQVGEEPAEACMHAAYDAGVNFFDNAESYAGGRAETVMGNILKRSGWGRDTFLVSSKVYWGSTGNKPNQRGLSRKHIFEACHRSLSRLQVDYLDLYYCHRPDSETPIEETVRAMHDLIAQGKVLYWGTSEWSAQEIQEAWSLADRHGLHKPQMEQPKYHMFHRHRVEVEYRHLYPRIGLGTTTFSPLATGLLSGKYNDGIPEGSRLGLQGYEWLRKSTLDDEGFRRIGKIKQLEPIARSLEASLAQLAIAWCLKNPAVSSVITGASKPEQVQHNMQALEVAAKLDGPMMEQIDGILASRPEAPEF